MFVVRSIRYCGKVVRSGDAEYGPDSKMRDQISGGERVKGGSGGGCKPATRFLAVVDSRGRLNGRLVRGHRVDP